MTASVLTAVPLISCLKKTQIHQFTKEQIRALEAFFLQIMLTQMDGALDVVVFEPRKQTFSLMSHSFIEYLAISVHCLIRRPWKQFLLWIRMNQEIMV